MSRKTISVLLLGLMVALAACSPAATPTPTAVPPTAVPPTAVPPTAVPPTPEPTAEPTAEPSTLTVFAAASLTDAFTEIGKNFEAANPGVTVVFNFAGSNQLAEQIGQGAPVDVFASANKTQMENAIKSGR